MTSGNPFLMYGMPTQGAQTMAPGLAPMQPQAAQAAPSIDFSKFDLSKPADQKALLGHLQTMYGDQQKLAEMAMAPAEPEDPRMAAQLGRPGVNGIINTWDPNGGSNSS